MKSILSCVTAGTVAAAMSCVAAGFVLAAEPAVKFTVAPAQIQALGIRTATLQQQASGIDSAYPAQVTVPINAEQVISAPVSGMVAQLLVHPNQAVRAGTPLIRIMSPELGQLQLQLLQANSRAALARQAAQRDKQLYDEGIIPQRRVQETQASMLQADAELHQAKAALRLSGMSEAAIKQLAKSGKPLDSVSLHAPGNGVITEIVVRPGQRVDASSALLHIVQSERLWLDIQVPASESGQWAAGTKLKIKDRQVTGHLLSTGATVAADSQTVVLRAAIDGKTTQLRPGEFVTVELPLKKTQESWDVPLAAVARDGDQAYLFVRTADGFEARPIKILASAGQQVRVQGAFKAGDQIAVSGVVALKGAWLDKKEQK